MDKYKRLASNTVVLMLGQMSSKLLVYVMMRFYTDILGADGYGAVGNIVDAAVLCIGIATLAIGEAIIRFGTDNAYDSSQVFSIGLVTTLGGLLLFIPFVPLIGLVDFLSQYSLLIYIYVFTGSFKSAFALFVRSSVSIRLYAVDGIITTCTCIGFNLLFLLALNMGVMGYVLSVVLADACSIIFLFTVGKLRRYLVIFGLDRQLAVQMYRYCIPMIPTTIMWWVTNVSDSFIVTSIMDTAATGVYKAAYKLPNIIALVSGIFSQAWNMSAITEKNSRTIARFYTDVFDILQSVIYVSASGMLLVIRPLLGIMAAGEAFDDAYLYTPMLVLSVIFSCFSTFCGSIYIADKKSMRSMLTAGAGALINIAANLALIPVIGLQGAALSTFASYLIVFAVRAVDTRKIVYMDYELPKIIANMIILTVMSAVIIFARNDTVYWIVLSAMFVFSLALNFRSGLRAVKFFLQGRVKKASAQSARSPQARPQSQTRPQPPQQSQNRRQGDYPNSGSANERPQSPPAFDRRRRK
jgi:O-antigen/teichoic acid export membrane protein